MMAEEWPRPVRIIRPEPAEWDDIRHGPAC